MIKIVRLITGEVIVGEVSQSVVDGDIVIERPALMQMQVIQPGKIGCGLIPYHPWANGPMVFFASSLLGPLNDADDHSAMIYDRQFNPSAVIVPEPGGLILD